MSSNSENIFIRSATADDLEALRLLSIQTFYETYAAFNTQHDMQTHVEQKFNAEILLKELQNADNHFFILFFSNDPAGYVKLRNEEYPEQLKGRRHIEIERIYMLNKFHGKGLGKNIMDYCCLYASQQGFEVIWLGVWKQNEKAFQFYTRCGFTIFGEHIFTLGNDDQWDWLMKKELKTNS